MMSSFLTRSPRKLRISLEGRVVLVTGAARGIGAMTAAAFSRLGAHVWLGDIDDDLAVRVAATLPNCTAIYLDVTDRGSWDAAIATVLEAAGRLDVLVNNAGIMPLGPLVDESDGTTDMTFDVNVRGVLNGMKTVLPLMSVAGHGHIVNVASMAARIPLPGMVTYNASKFAALGASLAAREEYRSSGVDICAILPSAVRTELSSGVALGRGMPTVDPERVAKAITRTLISRAAVTSVPHWIAPGWTVAQALTPSRLERLLRALLDDRRALNVDPGARGAYVARLQSHIRWRSA